MTLTDAGNVPHQFEGHRDGTCAWEYTVPVAGVSVPLAFRCGRELGHELHTDRMSATSEPSSGSVVLDTEGDAWQGYAGRWTCAHGAKRDPSSLSWGELDDKHGPVTVIFDRLAEEWRRIGRSGSEGAPHER